eukprot:g30073.t1
MSLQEMSHFEYEAEILQRLPTPLRKEVVLHIHRHILNSKLLLFKVPLPSWFQAVLLRLLEPQAFAPFELVLQSAEVTVSSDLIFVYDHSCEAFVHSGGRAMSHQPVRRRRRKKEVRVPYVDEAYTVLETYAPGAMLGFEQLLGEEALQSFGCPSDCAVRASSSGCNTFALKISAMLDAVRGMPGVDGMFLELIMSCILTEGKRRVKERGTNEFYQKIEAFRAAKQSYQANVRDVAWRSATQADTHVSRRQAMMPLGLRVAAYAPSEAGSASLSPMRTGTERSPGSVAGSMNETLLGLVRATSIQARATGILEEIEVRQSRQHLGKVMKCHQNPEKVRQCRQHLGKAQMQSGELEPPMPGQGDQMPPEPREGEAKPPAPGEGRTMLSAFGEGLLTSTTPPDSGSPPELHGLGPLAVKAPGSSTAFRNPVGDFQQRVYEVGLVCLAVGIVINFLSVHFWFRRKFLVSMPWYEYHKHGLGLHFVFLLMYVNPQACCFFTSRLFDIDLFNIHFGTPSKMNEVLSNVGCLSLLIDVPLMVLKSAVFFLDTNGLQAPKVRFAELRTGRR